MAGLTFRKVALERLSTPEQLDQALQITNPTGWLSMVTLITLVVSGIVWSLIGTIPEKVIGKGILINPGGVLDVISSTHGRLTRFAVQSGEWVVAGQIVAVVSQPDIENELDVARSRLAEAESQYQKLLDFQNRDALVRKTYAEQKRGALSQQIQFGEARVQWLTERQKVEAELLNKGLIPAQRVVNTRIEINNAKEELEKARGNVKQLDIEVNTFGIAKERERIDQDAKIAALRRDVETLRDRLLRNTQIVSPYSGQIVEFKVNSGEIVDLGRTLFSMLPEERWADGARRVSDLQAKLYVSPADGKKIRSGMPVQLSPSTVKREEFGFIKGKVIDVAAIPSTEEGIMRVLKNRQLVHELSGGGAPFEVTVQLERDDKSNNGYLWSSSAGPMIEMNPGTLAEGGIIIRNIRLISLVIPAAERLLEGDR